MTYRRLTAWTLAAMAALAIVIVLAVIVLARSERFSVWLLETIEARAGGQIELAGVAGTFAEEIRIGRVAVGLEAGMLTLENVRVRFDLSGLVARALIIDDASVGSATLDTTVRGVAASATSSPASVPVLMLIRSLRLDSITATMADASYALGPTRLGVRYVDGTADLTDVSTQFRDLAVDATAHLEIGVTVAIDANVCARGMLASEAIAGCVRVDGTYPALTIAAETSRPFAATAGGTVTAVSPVVVDIDLSWSDAALAARPEVRSPTAALHVFGPIDQLRVSGTATAVYADREAALDLSLVRGGDTIVVEAVTVTHAESTVQASGTIAADLSSASLSISGSHLDPSLVYADWPGDLELRAEVTAFNGAAPMARFEDLTLGGELRGYPIAATGGIDIDAERVTLRDLVVLSRVDQVSVAGTVGSTSDLALRAQIRDLAAWWPDLGGELEANVLMRGPVGAPRLSGDLALRNVRYADNAIASFAASGEAGLGDGDRIDLVAGATGLMLSGLAVEEVTAEVSGTLGAHRANIRARTDQWSFAGRADGGLEAREWRGRALALDVEPAGFDRWMLERPAMIAIGGSRVEVADACLAHAQARVCVDLTRAGQPDDFVRVNASQFDVDILSPLLPSGLDASGRLDAVVEIESVAGQLNGSARVEGEEGRVRVQITPGAEIDVPIDRLLVDATIDRGRLTLRGELETPNFANGTLDLTVDDLARDDSPVRAAIDLTWLDPAALTVLSPDIGAVAGTVYVDVNVDGRLDEPTARGEVRLEQGSIEVPVWGLIVERIDGRAEFTSSNEIRYSAKGAIDEAALTVEGETQLDPARSFPTTLRITGESIRLVQLSEAEVDVSPDLRATVALPKIDVTGRVDIPRARIAAAGLSGQASTPSRDTIVHGREEAEPERPLDVTAALTISLGDDVRYQDTKIDAQVSGDLDVNYESATGARAVGTLVLTGDYDAYGTLLTLEQGRLIFGGAWNNPSVDVRAVRRVEEITVGVQLTGTLNEPQTRIFSDPAMSETNALSYLLFGRPLEAASDPNTAVLENAAISMGLRQALPAIERIGETLGLDEFSIRGTATDAGALMAGKYLSPKVYLRYSYGLFNRIGGLLLRYRINERLSLETMSGEQKSMDLLYTVEKE